MSAVGRIRLQRSFRNFEGKQVCHVGHSVGLTFNLAVGTCYPIRRKSQRRGRYGGYLRKSDLDIFAFAADWRLERRSGYRLESRDDGPRIRRELGQLTRAKIISISLVGSLPRLVVTFRGGTRLEFLGDAGNTEDPFGWYVAGLPGLKRETFSLLD